jgi:hypothetical protein
MPHNSQIINPQFPTDDVVVIDYNVLDYGADPNSVNDSTRAIQRAGQPPMIVPVVRLALEH